MSAAAAVALKASESRKSPRQRISVALDVILLRSGVPENVPGRCLDLSEGGIGAMVAGELTPGQQVAIELRLPQVALPLRARARVRYQGKLRCGFEFVGLPQEQQQMIRYWNHHPGPQSPSPQSIPSFQREHAAPKLLSIAEPASDLYVSDSLLSFFSRFRALLLLSGAFLLLGAGALGYWHWQHSWRELEADVYAAQQAPLRVPAETMEQRIVSKTDPVYPEQARAAGKQGLAVLDAIIGEDGAVTQVNAISGDAVLVKAAADAVRQWKFEPYQFSGHPVRVETTIAVEFQLN